MFHHAPTRSFLPWCCRFKKVVIIHTIAIKITLKGVRNICVSTGMFDKEITSGDQRECFPLCQLVNNEEKGYTPPPPGKASLSRRCCTASSPPPQTASWCCLSSWHESACRDRQLRQQPPLLAYITVSFANGSARFMKESYKAHLANDVTVSLKLTRFNHQQSLLAPTERWIRLANCIPVTLRFFVMCMCAFVCVHIRG